MNHFCRCCGRASALGIDLTAHERAILYWVVRGETCPQIARRFGRAIGTVRSEVNRAHQKLGTNTRFNLIKIGTDYLDLKADLQKASRASAMTESDIPYGYGSGSGSGDGDGDGYGSGSGSGDGDGDGDGDGYG